MTSAKAVLRPQLDGWHLGDKFTQGTGGHGDTTEAYTETFSKVESLVSKTKRYNTGKKDNKGLAVYYTHKYKVKRVEIIKDESDKSITADINKISPMIANEFLSVGFSPLDVVCCYDLIRWIKNKDGTNVESKKGISFVIGDYEARLIKGKHVFLYKQKITRRFKVGK